MPTPLTALHSPQTPGMSTGGSAPPNSDSPLFCLRTSPIAIAAALAPPRPSPDPHSLALVPETYLHSETLQRAYSALP